MKLTRIVPILLAASFAFVTLAQTPSVGTRLAIPNSKLPVDVLVQGPTEAPGDLQVICLFSSVPENKLLASLATMDQQLGGLLTTVRTTALFRGDLGETMLLTPKPGVIAANACSSTVIDGGFTGTDTGTIGAEFITGFLRGRAVAAALHAGNTGPAPIVTRLTFLAGAAHALDTQKGMAAILNAK
jgi:hypothetical protein